jgi:cation diffusion facilitator family transporter
MNIIHPHIHTEAQTKRNAALVSVFAATGLVAAKLVGGYLTNSLALYSEAGHSGVDLLAAVISLIAIINAARPPDQEHHWGHAKFESIGALIELIFLLVLGATIVFRAQQRLLSPQPPEITFDLIAIILVTGSLSVDVWRTVALHRAAHKTGSEALSASAVHFLSDLLGTIVVVFGLIMSALGVPKADSIAALVIAAMVLFLSYKLGRRVFSSLTDRAPAGLASMVAVMVQSVPDVIGVHDIRVRQAGSEYFAEMHVNLSPELSLERAHDVLDEIEIRLMAKYPKMHVVTHPEPWSADFEHKIGPD